MDVLQKNEGVRPDRMFAHGGQFKNRGVAQKFFADVSVHTAAGAAGDVAQRRHGGQHLVSG